MAHRRNLNLSIYEQGAVLVPVLLLASMITLGIVVLLQTQLIQKKSLGDFKFFLQERRKGEQQHDYLQSLPVDQLLELKTLKLIQQVPTNLHYCNLNSDYYFQYDRQKYIRKSSFLDNTVVMLTNPTEFNYRDTVIKVIQTLQSDQVVLYLYDVKNDKFLFHSTFEQQALFQLVGNPVDSIYIVDSVGLYKIDLTPIKPIGVNLLQLMDNNLGEPQSDPIVTRDARGDGRLITLAMGDSNIFVYHEPSQIKHNYLDLFEHDYFPGS